jgi:hypothetical protein
MAQGFVVQGIKLESKGQTPTFLQRSKNSMTRPVVAYALCQYAGCTQRTAADVLCLSSGAAVSFQLKKLHDLLRSDKALQAILEQLEKRLCVRSLSKLII